MNNTMNNTAQSIEVQETQTGGAIRIIGIVLAAAVSIPAILELCFNVYLPGPLQEIALIALPVGALISYLIVGLKDCLSTVWKVVKSGFYFPLWPINFITGFITLSIGVVMGLLLPVVVIGIVLFKNR